MAWASSSPAMGGFPGSNTGGGGVWVREEAGVVLDDGWGALK